jgi:hypothetical protein
MLAWAHCAGLAPATLEALTARSPPWPPPHHPKISYEMGSPCNSNCHKALLTLVLAARESCCHPFYTGSLVADGRVKECPSVSSWKQKRKLEGSFSSFSPFLPLPPAAERPMMPGATSAGLDRLWHRLHRSRDMAASGGGTRASHQGSSSLVHHVLGSLAYLPPELSLRPKAKARPSPWSFPRSPRVRSFAPKKYNTMKNIRSD